MPLRCGWPRGPRKEDGPRDQPATVVYIVRVHDVPLVDPDSDRRTVVLTLCPDHSPPESDE
jgi:hypothetical protein